MDSDFSETEMDSDSESELDLDTLEDFRKSLVIANLSPMEARLHEAAKFGQFHVMKKLLADEKIDVNSKDTEQKTVLHNASSQGMLHKEIIEDENEDESKHGDKDEDEDESEDKTDEDSRRSQFLKLLNLKSFFDTTPEVVQLLINHGAKIGKKCASPSKNCHLKINIILPFSL